MTTNPRPATFDAYCAFCGETVETDVSFRCPRCGKLAIAERPAERPNGLPAKTADSSTIGPVPILDGHAALQAWRRETIRTLYVLQQERGEIVKDLTARKSRLDQLGKVIAALNAVLGPVKQEEITAAAEGAKASAKPTKGTLLAAKGIWSRQYAACVQCGTTEVEHKAHGLCKLCGRQADYQRQKAKKAAQA